MTTDTMTLTTSIADLPGAEPNTVDAMARLGLRCVADLLLHMPTRYRRSRPWQAIAGVAAAAEGDTNDEMEVHGEIVSVERGFGRVAKVEAVIEDDSGEIDLVFFNQPWIQRTLHPGMKVLATGRPRVYKSRVQIANPQWWGDWLVWDGPPELQVFMTTNAVHVAPARIWKDYLILARGGPGLEQRLDRYRINTIVMHKELQPRLIRIVRRYEDWKITYEDEVGLVAVRRSTSKTQDNEKT